MSLPAIMRLGIAALREKDIDLTEAVNIFLKKKPVPTTDSRKRKSRFV